MPLEGRHKQTAHEAPFKAHVADLRRRAERDLAAVGRPSPILAREDVEALLYELQVHQIELEMQCRQLQEAQCETEESRNLYRELYESLPIGYATVDGSGRICDLNPAGASLLGLASSQQLPNFHVFVATGDLNRFDLFCRDVLAKNQGRTGEFLLERADGATIPAEVTMNPARAFPGPPRLRLAFHDISGRKATEQRARLQRAPRSNELQLLPAQDERRRLVAKFQDDQRHRLESCITELRSVAERLDRRERERIEGLAGRLAGLDGDLRNFTQDLNLADISGGSLIESMRRYVEDLSVSSRLSIDLIERTVPGDLPRPLAQCLFRPMQEALNNVVKHARATRAALTVAGVGGGIEMTITDNGRGFDLTQVLGAKKGHGLMNIEEWVRWLGGKVVIQSQPGKGAELSICVPLSTAAACAPIRRIYDNRSCESGQRQESDQRNHCRDPQGRGNERRDRVSRGTYDHVCDHQPGGSGIGPASA